MLRSGLILVVVAFGTACSRAARCPGPSSHDQRASESRLAEEFWTRYPGKWGLLKDGRLVGVFESAEESLKAMEQIAAPTTVISPRARLTGFVQ